MSFSSESRTTYSPGKPSLSASTSFTACSNWSREATCINSPFSICRNTRYTVPSPLLYLGGTLMLLATFRCVVDHSSI